ncbi:hypothetical protein AAF712_002539 [Marasmius tenuissimus]|uniref:Uncharacterized protein n=1 Tax=Marasmius tenuissimus TaxID=585030 RepID=A0ABR3AAF8_9AGAR
MDGISPTLMLVRANTQREDTRTVPLMHRTEATLMSDVAISIEEDIVLDIARDHNESRTL